jgi:DNA-directed RNA polymerase alpha subunit
MKAIEDILRIPVEDLDISVNTLDKFKKAGVGNLGDIRAYTESDMALLINSRKSFLRLIEEMKKWDIRFKSHFE